MIAVRNVRAVLPDRILDDATIVAETGRIVQIVERGVAPADAVDGRGAFCLPGIVDTHSDGMEKEVQPRPGARFAYDFSLSSFEGRVRAAGVTTVFHGVAFENDWFEDRNVEVTLQTCAAIAERRAGEPMVDHHLLHRLDARDPTGLDALRQFLAEAPRAADEPAPLVSFEDHTPGQGQYADPTVLRDYIERTRKISREAADQWLAELTSLRDARLGQRDTALDWLGEQAQASTIRLLAHDPGTADEIALMVARNASVAEFPTTVEAAAAAQDAGMATVLGAPNILRGGSHSGNVSAEELVAKGLCTALASDYLPPALLAAAFMLADRGIVSLPEAVTLVTSGPAEVAGLTDRGSLTPGQRADLILVTLDHGWPTVRAVVRPEDGR